MSADLCVEWRWHSCLQMGLGYLHRAAALLMVFKLPLKVSKTVFLHLPTQRMTHSQACLGNLETHFCWEATQATAAGSERLLGAYISSLPYLPLDNCKDTSAPCQGTCLKQQALSFASVMLVCSAWMEGKAKSQVTQQNQADPSVP